jgi:hypothetical protein
MSVERDPVARATVWGAYVVGIVFGVLGALAVVYLT